MAITIKTPAFIQVGSYDIPIELYDEIRIKITDERKIALLKTSGHKFPTNDSSPVFKAAYQLMKRKSGKFGAVISIRKNIPAGCGLSDEKANAIGTLLALNKEWKINLSKTELKSIARKCNCRIRPKKTMRYVILANPKYIRNTERLSHGQLLKRFPDLRGIIRTFKKHGAEISGISGSGPVIYGLFKTKPPIKELKKVLDQKTDFFWAGTTCTEETVFDTLIS